jgi:DNA polymerase I-like protein with 3'-5' exonuclease and polymerase domains
VYVNADASQLQFRIFAHYADDPKITDAYAHDRNWREIDRLAAALTAQGVPKKQWPSAAKLTDFHDAVGDLVLQFAHKQLIRTHVKNINFAQVFGAGVPKMAAQLGVPADQIPSYALWAEACRNRTTHTVGGPQFLEVVQLSETYHEMFPSVKPLLALTSHLAMPRHRREGCGKACREFHRQGYPHRGWVRTFLGRRARFNDGDRFYSALNRIIQGTEADVIKRILIDVHNRRHELGLIERFTVHDAVAGDLHGDPAQLKEALNHQYYDFKVPILWEVGVGKTWADAK